MNTEFSYDFFIATPLKMYGDMSFGYIDYENDDKIKAEKVSSGGYFINEEEATTAAQSGIFEPMEAATSMNITTLHEKNNNDNIDTMEVADEVSVEDLLEACHAVLDSEGNINEVEPTPIGPLGIEKVVNDVPIYNAPWLQTVKEFSSQYPLLLDTRTTTASTTTKTTKTTKTTSKTKTAVNHMTMKMKTNKHAQEKPQQQKEEEQKLLDKVKFSLKKENGKAKQWNERFDDLITFKQKFNHCLVPLYWPSNPSLAHWVKRQRYQYGLKQEGKYSTLSDEREEALNVLGFVWDSHSAIWEERWNELREFRDLHGHANLSTKSKDNPKLSIWVKCQRRQFKLLQAGKKSTMTKQRIHKLLELGFEFDRRLQKF